MAEESDADLRRQLLEACANVRRQIEVQQSSRNYRAFNDDGRRKVILGELEAELVQLEEALAQLEEP